MRLSRPKARSKGGERVIGRGRGGAAQVQVQVRGGHRDTQGTGWGDAGEIGGSGTVTHLEEVIRREGRQGERNRCAIDIREVGEGERLLHDRIPPARLVLRGGGVEARV